jgi:hypothetical protein
LSNFGIVSIYKLNAIRMMLNLMIKGNKIIIVMLLICEQRLSFNQFRNGSLVDILIGSFFLTYGNKVDWVKEPMETQYVN